MPDLPVPGGLDASVAASLTAAEAALARLESALQPYLGRTLESALSLGGASDGWRSTALALAASVAALVRLTEATAGRAPDADPALTRQLAAVEAAVRRVQQEKRRRKAEGGEGGGGGGGGGPGSAHGGAAAAAPPPPRPGGQPPQKKKKRKRGGRKR